MTEYGHIINPSYDPSKNKVYEVFCDYFNNPIMTKIKNVENFSMYMVKIHAMIGNAYRYLVIFVDIDSNIIGFNEYMKKLEWVSLQTRTLEDIHHIQTHRYDPKTSISELSQKIFVKDRDEKETKYICEQFPLIVTLLHTRKNYVMQYPNNGSIISAIETYQTLFNFK
jgi:hypothetical protein